MKNFAETCRSSSSDCFHHSNNLIRLLRRRMGNILSEVPLELTQKQKDIQKLGDNFPFGDDELEHLYDAYHAVSTIPSEEESHQEAAENYLRSFLGSWSYACCGSVKTGSSEGLGAKEERKMLIQIVESKILPNGFGNRLYRAAFLVPGDTDVYATTATTSSSSTSKDGISQTQSPPQTQTTSITTDEYTRTRRLEKTFEGFTFSSRRGSSRSTKVMFDACIGNDSDDSCDNGPTTRKRAIDFVSQGYRLALATAFLQAAASDDDMGEYLPTAQQLSGDHERILEAFAASIIGRARRRRSQSGLPVECPELDQGLVQLDDVQDWIEGVAPLYASILPTFFNEILFPGRPYPPSRTAFDFPKVIEESDFFSSSCSPMLFKLACLSSSLAGSYFRLYASSHDGLSFNRLQNALLGYSGPTLLMICSTGGAIFGAFTASAWKESKDFYGNTDCFLFSLSPVTAVYRPSGNQRNFMYCNSYARSRGYDGQAHGIGYGGSVTEPRLFLSESFDDCRAGARCLTFENGSLLPNTASGAAQTHFDIDSIEVWGVGGDDIVNAALGERKKARAVKAEGIRRARKVDKAQFLDDFRSGIIDSKAFQHRQQVDGRADQDIKEKWTKQYDYEK